MKIKYIPNIPEIKLFEESSKETLLGLSPKGKYVLRTLQYVAKGEADPIVAREIGTKDEIRWCNNRQKAIYLILEEMGLISAPKNLDTESKPQLTNQGKLVHADFIERGVYSELNRFEMLEKLEQGKATALIDKGEYLEGKLDNLTYRPKGFSPSYADVKGTAKIYEIENEFEAEVSIFPGAYTWISDKRTNHCPIPDYDLSPNKLTVFDFRAQNFGRFSIYARNEVGDKISIHLDSLESALKEEKELAAKN